VPTRPSCKGRINVNKTFGGGEGKMKSGGKRKVEPGLIAFERNFEFCY
jgi:hypothetical protein